jgi:RNA polymerase sigma factor (sigma-70 family)
VDQGPDSFRNWLLGIVEMKARRAVQRHAGAAKRALSREVTRQLRVDTAGYPGNDTSPSQAAVGSELEELALRAMASLPDHYWEVLHLTRSEHLSLREVAERLGSPRERVKKLYRRALKEFTETFNRLRGETHAG